MRESANRRVAAQQRGVNIAFVSQTEGVDPPTPHGKKLFPLLGGGRSGTSPSSSASRQARKRWDTGRDRISLRRDHPARGFGRGTCDKEAWISVIHPSSSKRFALRASVRISKWT